MTRGRAAAMALCSFLAACGEAAKPAAAPATEVRMTSPSSPPGPAADAAVTDLPAGAPDTPAGHALGWLLGAFAAPPDEAALGQRFAPSFTAQHPAAEIAQTVAQVGAQLAPFVIDRIDDGATPTALVAIVRPDRPGSPAADAPRMRIELSVDPAEPHVILRLGLRPALEVKAASSWDDVHARLRGVGAPQVGFLAAEIDGGKCAALSAIEPKKPLALGSAFKLYVLYALGKSIEAGKHGWDEPVAIEESKKSLPSGDMRDEPAGKSLPLRTFAEKMIAVSDNTATDHLIALVGRVAVEDAVKATGHANPARMVPFLSTRDLFAMKLLAAPDELAAYAAADTAKKRKLLESYEQRDLGAALQAAGGWSRPRMIDSIEWLASPDDLCKLMVALKAQADAPKTAPVGAILSVNPGIPDEKGTYRYVGFKGGSEPGVMNLTWLLQRKSDDKWLFLTAGFNSPAGAIDEEKAAMAAAAARDFLANNLGK
jgi:hypothetical protein